MTLPTSLTQKSSLFWIGFGFLAALCVGALDFITGWELSFSLFYLLPILFITWYAGRNPGLFMSLLCGGIWFAADALGGHVYSNPAFRYWNALVRLTFFILVTLLLPSAKALGKEKKLARMDHLTGAANRRHFFEVAREKLDDARHKKSPITIAYIDIDDFKTVNDRLGHRVGDELLRSVVQRINRHLRKDDLLARLGGDEFVVLLPVTGQGAAEVVVTKLQTALKEEMRLHNWPVTFSIGALTCTDGRLTSDELINLADDLMYEVKTKGKNGISYGLHPAVNKGRARPAEAYKNRTPHRS